jgi:hypothetical protein
MSMNIPSGFDFDVDVTGIPSNLTVNSTLNPVQLNLGRMQLDLGPVQLLPVEVRPIDFTLRVKEIPSVRVHLPVDYHVGFSLFGVELFGLRLCGQGQVITEPYVANPCETRAGAQPTLQQLDQLVRGNGG